jgi:hypothetical protein
MAAKQPKTGPFGEAIFPESEADVTMDAMVRYHSREGYSKVAAFYREQYSGVRYMTVTESDENGETTLCIGTSPKCDVGNFSVLLVMPMPDSEDGKDVWILALVR